MFGGALQPFHLIVILVLALIVFGPGKLSNLGGSLGKSVRDFRSAIKDEPDEDKKEGDSATKS